MGTRLGAAGLFLLVALHGTWAVATPAATPDRYQVAERLAAQGRLLVRVGALDRGLQAIEDAYRTNPDPHYVLEQAKILDAAGRTSPALMTYRRFLQVGVASAGYAQARTRTEELAQALRQSHGEVIIAVDPRPGLVMLEAPNGTRTPVTLDETLHLPVGEYAILVEEPGYVATRLAFNVEPGETAQRIDVLLQPEVQEGLLIVRSQQPEAEVSLDGNAVCVVPCERTLAPGTYLVEVAADGFVPLQQVVRVRAGATVDVDAVLARRPQAVRDSPTDVAHVDVPSEGDGAAPDEVAAPDAPSDAGEFEIPEPPESSPGRDGTLRILGWVALGVGAGAAAAGGAMNYLTFAKADEANGLSPDTPDYDSAFDSLQREVERNALLTPILYGVGGALVAGGVTMLILDALWATDAPAEGEVIPVAPGVAPLPGGFSVNATVRF